MLRDKMTRAEKQSLRTMKEELMHEYMFFQQHRRFDRLVPEGWQDVDATSPVEPRKTKITIRLDADMVKWFRHIGHGYQRRMNAVLRAYMHAVLSRYVTTEKDYGVDGELI